MNKAFMNHIGGELEPEAANALFFSFWTKCCIHIVWEAFGFIPMGGTAIPFFHFTRQCHFQIEFMMAKMNLRLCDIFEWYIVCVRTYVRAYVLV